MTSDLLCAETLWTFRLYIRWCWANLCVRLRGGWLSGGVTSHCWIANYPVKRVHHRLPKMWTVTYKTELIGHDEFYLFAAPDYTETP